MVATMYGQPQKQQLLNKQYIQPNNTPCCKCYWTKMMKSKLCSVSLDQIQVLIILTQPSPVGMKLNRPHPDCLDCCSTELPMLIWQHSISGCYPAPATKSSK